MEQESNVEKKSEEQPSANKNSYGSVISIILILIVLVAGAYYVGHKRLIEYRANKAAPVQSY